MEGPKVETLGRLAGIAFGAQGADEIGAGAQVLAQGIVAGCQEGALVLASAIQSSMQAPARGLALGPGRESDPVIVESSRRQQSRDRTLLERVFPGKGWGGAVAAFGQGRYLAGLLGGSAEQREYAGIGAGLGFLVGGPVGALVGGLLGGLFGSKEKPREDPMQRAFWNSPEGMEIQAYLYNITQALKQWGLPSLAPQYSFAPAGALSPGYVLGRAQAIGSGGLPWPAYSLADYAWGMQAMLSRRGPSGQARAVVSVQKIEVNVRADSAQAGKEAARQLWREFAQFAELDAPLTGLVEL
jgi:hypothetical protein